MINKIILFIFLSIYTFDVVAAGRIGLVQPDKATAVVYTGKQSVVQTAIGMLLDDARKVTTHGFVLSPQVKSGCLVVGVMGEDSQLDQLLSRFNVDVSALQGQWEAFQLEVVEDKQESYLLVIGSDARGAAYAVLELSRLMGISPWEWWADAVPNKKKEIFLPKGYRNIQKPSVKYRGIFLNDEDWGLTPWSAENYEPDARLIGGIDAEKLNGMRTIGPRTYAKIFELLLRLRANTIWPAMHEVTVPFYFVEGNREMAEKFGIYISTTHCEPLARNSATEWDIVGKGDYNYLTNKENVLSYWEDRLKELKNSDNIFTIGMRGKHDGRMEGVKTTREYKDALDLVIKDQTELLKKHINPDPGRIPQILIPYKEVLEVYRAGLDVPDYVTLLWCDDNYGYVRHFPDEQERQRIGGNGVYYHISYWGRPHDYLWLSTNHPALLYTQMKTSYDKGARDMWIVNVGDIKPGEYLVELFLDMAWDIDAITDDMSGLDMHLQEWLSREFGPKYARELRDIMNEYYRLAYIRKPEFMGNTRTEERESAYKEVKDLPWSEQSISERILAYEKLIERMRRVAKHIPEYKRDAWFQLVEYPVQGAAEMNKKHLYAQLARHGKVTWQASDSAYEAIIALTEQYSSLGEGKWRYMMSHHPRRLAVFDRLERGQAVTPLIIEDKPLYTFNGKDFKRYQGQQPICHGLGYERGAISLLKGATVEYDFKFLKHDSLRIEVALTPNHPIEGRQIRFGISINDGPMQVVDYHTVDRSEEWKENVLNNRAVRRFSFAPPQQRKIRLRIQALDDGVVLDQINIRK